MFVVECAAIDTAVKTRGVRSPAAAAVAGGASPRLFLRSTHGRRTAAVDPFFIKYSYLFFYMLYSFWQTSGVLSLERIQ